METIKLPTVSKARRCSYKQLALIEQMSSDQNVTLPASGSQQQKLNSKGMASNIIRSLMNKTPIEIIFE